VNVDLFALSYISLQERLQLLLGISNAGVTSFDPSYTEPSAIPLKC